MKNFYSILLLLAIAISVNAQTPKNEVISNFIKSTVNIEGAKISEFSPISSFNELASKQAAKSIMLTKENANESLAEAKKYSACFITVGSHTIVKVEDQNKTLMSGSWDTEMPYGKGYVQKGQLIEKEDYINNIIGIPDSQRRMMFLFK